MKYKPTLKFKTLNKLNAHQGLSREEFIKFMDGKTVDCDPPKRLIDEKYLKKVGQNGNSG